MVESDYRQHNKEKLEKGDSYKGPQHVARGCTDVLFLLAFVLFWAGMALIAGFSLQNGRPLIITNGYDYEGNICGVGDMADYPFNYFPMPLYVAYSVCVKSCPTSFSAGYCAQPVTVTKTDALSQLVAMMNGGPTFRITACPEGTLPLPPSMSQALSGTGLKQALALSDCISNFTTIALNTNVSRSLVDLPPGKCFSTYPTSAFKTRCMPNPLPSNVETGFVFTLDAGSLLGMPPSASTSTKSGSAAPITGFADVFNSAALSFSDMMAQIQRNYQWIIICAGIALLFSMIYAQLLKFFAMPMTWITIILANLFLLATGILALLKSGSLNVQTLPGYNVISGLDPAMAAMLLNSTNDLVNSVSSSKAFSSANASFVGAAYNSLSTEQQQKVGHAFGSICVIGSGVLFLLSIVLCRQIIAAVNVLKKAAGCMVSMWGLLLFPVILFILLCVLYTYWIFVAVYLASAGKYNPVSKLYELDENLRKAAAYHLFGLLWTKQFLVGIAQVKTFYFRCKDVIFRGFVTHQLQITFSGAVGQWYFTPAKERGSGWPITAAFGRTLRYHIGTAAFGSFLIAFVEFVRIVVQYYVSKMKELEQRGFTWMKCLICCVECCLGCLERFLKYASKIAYIQVGLHGYSFCGAVRSAFSLMMRNVLRLSALTAISGIFIFLGKLVIMLATTLAGALLINRWPGGPSTISLPSSISNASAWLASDQYSSLSSTSDLNPLPILLIALLSYGVACFFMGVYDAVIDTIFQCFVEDDERTGGKYMREEYAAEEAGSDNLEKITSDAATREKNENATL